MASAGSDEEHGRDDGDDEADDVEFEDVASAEQVRDESTDHGTGQSDEQCGDPARVLFPGLDQPGHRTDTGPATMKPIMIPPGCAAAGVPAPDPHTPHARS